MAKVKRSDPGMYKLIDGQRTALIGRIPGGSKFEYKAGTGPSGLFRTKKEAITHFDANVFEPDLYAATESVVFGYSYRHGKWEVYRRSGGAVVKRGTTPDYHAALRAIADVMKNTNPAVHRVRESLDEEIAS